MKKTDLAIALPLTFILLAGINWCFDSMTPNKQKSYETEQTVDSASMSKIGETNLTISGDVVSIKHIYATKDGKPVEIDIRLPYENYDVDEVKYYIEFCGRSISQFTDDELKSDRDNKYDKLTSKLKLNFWPSMYDCITVIDITYPDE